MPRFSKAMIVVIVSLVAAYPLRANAQASNPSVLGLMIGGLLHNAAVSQAQRAWNAYDVAVVECINESGQTDTSVLINNGILPNDPRLAPSIQSCQAEIAAQEQQAALQQQQQQAQAVAEQQAEQQQALQQAQQQAAAALAAQQQAQAAAEQQMQIAADTRQAAGEQVTLAQAAQAFSAFQKNSDNPADSVAALLNYASFGADNGTSLAFWMRKPGTKSVYAEYEQGISTQNPAQKVQELDVSKIDSSNLYVQQNAGQVVTIFGKIVFASCSSCSLSIVRTRWVGFFQTHTY